ncbi:MAG: hypothetical protein ACYC7A_10640 [Thermoanaerobaculia bacterium]
MFFWRPHSGRYVSHLGRAFCHEASEWPIDRAMLVQEAVERLGVAQAIRRALVARASSPDKNMEDVMTEYLLRIEGVNLGNFVYDAQELSTIRGGSLLLLDVPRQVQEFVKARWHIKLEDISTGASSGLFAFECENSDAETARNIRDSIAEHVRTDPHLKHGTFVVDFQRQSGSFETDNESVLARNRWAQMRQPSLAVPRSAGSTNECEIDHVRPAEPKKRYSASVAARQKHGRDSKREFYLNQMRQQFSVGIPGPVLNALEHGFVNTLDQLTHDSGRGSLHHNRGSLHHKMAVIYFDGNKFGTIQRHLDREQLHWFDTTLKGYRRALLAALLEEVGNDSATWLYDGPENPDEPSAAKWKGNRLETLLWGGDELTWVVPAWAGWRVVEFFYSESASWNFNATPLTHGGGIVFCHHKAPIHRITRLAHDLAEEAKKVAHKATESVEKNVFAYQVLESFDDTGPALTEFRERRAVGRRVEELILRGDAMKTISANAARIRETVPHSKLHDIVQALLIPSESPSEADLLMKKADALIKKTLDSLDGSARVAVEAVLAGFGGTKTSWVHLAELWDYLPEA